MREHLRLDKDDEAGDKVATGLEAAYDAFRSFIQPFATQACLDNFRLVPRACTQLLLLHYHLMRSKHYGLASHLKPCPYPVVVVVLLLLVLLLLLLLLLLEAD